MPSRVAGLLLLRSLLVVFRMRCSCSTIRAHCHALSCHCGIPVGPCHAWLCRRVVVVVDGQFKTAVVFSDHPGHAVMPWLAVVGADPRLFRREPSALPGCCCRVCRHRGLFRVVGLLPLLERNSVKARTGLLCVSLTVTHCIKYAIISNIYIR